VDSHIVITNLGTSPKYACTFANYINYNWLYIIQWNNRVSGFNLLGKQINLYEPVFINGIEKCKDDKI